MKIVLTGGSGFIGSKLITALRNRGHEVTGIVRGIEPTSDLVNADIGDIEALKSLADEIGPADFLVHCAAIAHGQKVRPPMNIYYENMRLSNNIAQAFGGSIKNIIFSSSIEVYGLYESVLAKKCFIPPKPISEYGKSKLDSESIFLDIFNINVHILRCAPVYDDVQIYDLSKRVYFPGSRIRVRLLPAPFHSFTNINLIIEKVLKIISNPIDGKFLHQIVDERATSQEGLLRLFSGFTIILPRLIVLYCVRFCKRLLDPAISQDLL